MLVAGRDPKRRLPDWPGAARLETAATICAAEEIGLLAGKALHDGAMGRVGAVFERSFYAVVEGTWICVGQSSIGSGPLQLLGNFRWPRLAVGDPARIADSIMWVAGVPLATLASASVWTPGAVPCWSEDSLERGLRAVDDLWSDGLTAEGLAVIGSACAPGDPSLLVRAAQPGVIDLQNILASVADDGDHVSGLGSLVGLGPGLTPSGDDLIGGALIALATLGQIERRDALRRHCRALLQNTNDISRAHLQAAALGYGAAALHDAIHATMSGEADRVRRALDVLAMVGHTSGGDAFAGSLIVLRRAVRKP